MNGKSVEVDNTDAEGRLVLAGVYTWCWMTSWRTLKLTVRRIVLCIERVEAAYSH